jgi:hypothetical protein
MKKIDGTGGIRMDWQAIIAQGESRTVEFKSDRGPLPDRVLIK